MNKKVDNCFVPDFVSNNLPWYEFQMPRVSQKYRQPLSKFGNRKYLHNKIEW